MRGGPVRKRGRCDMIYQVGKMGQEYLSATPHRPPPLPPWRGGESLGEVYTMYKAELCDKKYKVDLEVGHYPNGRLAIMLRDARDGSPISFESLFSIAPREEEGEKSRVKEDE